MAQAFASDAAAQTDTTAQPEAATTQPAETTTAPATTHTSEKTGPIPFDVHKTALDNARTKARAEVEAELGWAKTVDRAQVEEAARIGHMYQTDKPAYIRQVLAEALADQELAPLVRSEAARVLGSRPKEQTQTDELAADIPVVDENGRVVSHSFSADRVKQLLKQERESLKQELLGEIAPLKQREAVAKQQEHQRQEQAHIEKTVQTVYEQATSDLPMFKEHEAEISKAFADIPGDPGTALYRAWAKVVLPKLEANNQSKTLDELKTKAAASVGNPNAAVVATTKRPRSLTDSSLQW